MKEVWVILRYRPGALTPGGEARCEPSTEEELVEEIDRSMNASHFGGLIELEIANNVPKDYIQQELRRATEEEHALKLRISVDLRQAHDRVKRLRLALLIPSPELKKARIKENLCVYTGEKPNLICGGYLSDLPTEEWICEVCRKRLKRD